MYVVVCMMQVTGLPRGTGSATSFSDVLVTRHTYGNLQDLESSADSH